MEYKLAMVKMPACKKQYSDQKVYVKKADDTFVEVERPMDDTSYQLVIDKKEGARLLPYIPNTKETTDKMYYMLDNGLMKAYEVEVACASVAIFNVRTKQNVMSSIFAGDDSKFYTDLLQLAYDDGHVELARIEIPEGKFNSSEENGYKVIVARAYRDEEHASWYEQPEVDGKRETPLADLMEIDDKVIEELRRRFKAFKDYAKQNMLKVLFYEGNDSIEVVKNVDGYEIEIDDNGKPIPYELCYHVGDTDSYYCECNDYMPVVKKIKKSEGA